MAARVLGHSLSYMCYFIVLKVCKAFPLRVIDVSYVLFIQRKIIKQTGLCRNSIDHV